MKTPIITEKHERRISRAFTSRELPAILEAAVLAEIADHDHSLPTTVDLSVSDETAGSPPYRVGTKAAVVITIDLTPTPAASA